MARISTVVFTLGLALFTTATSNNGSCYWLDGTAAPYHVPCSNAAVTNCCLSSALCMSNGLCYLQDDMGLMLTRGACTDQNWSSACFAPCSDSVRNTGVHIYNVDYNLANSQYCCGKVTYDQAGPSCAHDQPFYLPPATAIPGVAGLATASASTASASTTASPGSPGSTTTVPAQTSSSSHDIAIGAGVGVPLGVIAIASLVWALWERRQRRQAKASEAHVVKRNAVPRELADSQSCRQHNASELGNVPHRVELEAGEKDPYRS